MADGRRSNSGSASVKLSRDERRKSRGERRRKAGSLLRRNVVGFGDVVIGAASVVVIWCVVCAGRFFSGTCLIVSRECARRRSGGALRKAKVSELQRARPGMMRMVRQRGPNYTLHMACMFGKFFASSLYFSY